MSYWTGTLPMGPVGCTWAPVPLQYDTINYPFTVSVGFVSDGTTALATGDLNGDNAVNSTDFSLFRGNFGAGGTGPAGQDAQDGR